MSLLPLCNSYARRNLYWLFVICTLLAVALPSTLHAQQASDLTASDAIAETSAAPHAQSQLMWIIHTSGWIGLVLLLISFYFVALVTQLFLELRERIVAPPELLDECGTLLTKRDYNGVYKASRDSDSYLGDLIAAGLAAYSNGLSESREAIDREGEAVTVELERRISMLAVIGSLGPMIGLLGTLKGMIASFSVIATSETQMKASEVAGGISEALLITFEGVALSVPAIYFFAVFKNRVSTLAVQTINRADEFLRKFHHVAQTRQVPATTSAQA